jgi:tetrapyrrole methylase family protein/MazG family protein
VATITIVGLGPAGIERVAAPIEEALVDPDATVVVRTGRHPAATQLAVDREIATCDDLYAESGDFDTVYEAMAARIIDHAAAGSVVYAVPGSAVVGERSVSILRERAAAAGHTVAVIPGESFLDLVYAAVGLDPIARGVQILDGRDLPDPLPLHLPTIVSQVDRPIVLADAVSELGRVLPLETPVTFLDALGSPDERVIVTDLGGVGRLEPGPRTTLYLDPPPAGWHGLVVTNRLLREQCPWDREQTHHSLVSHLVEEAYETVEALSALSPTAPGGDADPDYGAYAEVEEELGDLLLQVVFHATLAREVAAFDVEEVAEGIRRKLVHRHPHVFGEVTATEPAQVLANWEALKAAEKRRESLMDDVPTALPAIARADKLQRRAASVGFDWDDPTPVLAKLHEEIEELGEAIRRLPADPGNDDERSAVHDELGDVLFAVVNLSRHLALDPELALRHAAGKFADRFRVVEALAAEGDRDLCAMSLVDMDELWQQAKTDGGGAGDTPDS